MSRPVLLVLAGVNGAGKSSIGGHLIKQQGLSWFNPDSFARELVAATGCELAAAQSVAWAEGLRRLDEAIVHGLHHAFETTLGGHTIVDRLLTATRTHDVLVWFCGLASPEQHMARVKIRVAHGGHDIPEAKIRERYPRALCNLLALMPDLTHLKVYDNSTDVAAGDPVPDPRLVLEMVNRRIVWPVGVADMERTPDWAKPIVEAALNLSDGTLRS